ncbi:permease prefix domain 1-containing protein [Catenulispora yoronensis]
MTYRSIESYVDDLAWRLRVGRRGRRRIADEVTAHLADLVAEEEAAGLTPQAATRAATARFGSPERIAAEFNRDSALHSARTAAWTLTACVAMAFVAAGFALRGGAPAHPWPDGRLYYAVPALLVQVAIFCAGTALLLSVVAPWLLGGPPQGLATAARALAAATVVLIPVAVVSAGNIVGAGGSWGRCPRSWRSACRSRPCSVSGRCCAPSRRRAWRRWTSSPTAARPSRGAGPGRRGSTRWWSSAGRRPSSGRRG